MSISMKDSINVFNQQEWSNSNNKSFMIKMVQQLRDRLKGTKLWVLTEKAIKHYICETNLSYGITKEHGFSSTYISCIHVCAAFIE